MSPIVELRISDPPLFGATYDAVPALETTVEDIHDVREGTDRHYVIFVWVSGCAFEDFERAAETDEYTRAFQELTTQADRRLYRITTETLPEERMLYPFFRRQDITLLDAEGSSDGIWIRLRLADRESLRTLVEKLESLDVDPTIERLFSSGTEEPPEEGLTERQRESLRCALEHGYFESPSQVTLDELAAGLDITAQTLSKHIRSGVRKLVESEL